MITSNEVIRKNVLSHARVTVSSDQCQMFGLCENAWFPRQPIIRLSKLGCTYNTKHISVATYCSQSKDRGHLCKVLKKYA